MLKAMRLHIGMVKQEIELSIFFPTILLCLLTIMTSVRWAMPFLGSVCGLTYGYLNQGFHRLLAESAPGGEYETVRLLPISAKDMVWSKICLCGIWFSLTTSLQLLCLIVMFNFSGAYMKDYSPTATYIYAEKIVYRLSLLGFSTAEVVIAMVLIPFVFFLAGVFVGCALMWVHLWISQNGEKKKRGPWFTTFVYILLLASVVGLFWIGERLAGICPWGFGVLVGMMLLLGGVDIVVGKKCARRMKGDL